MRACDAVAPESCACCTCVSIRNINCIRPQCWEMRHTNTPNSNDECRAYDARRSADMANDYKCLRVSVKRAFRTHGRISLIKHYTKYIAYVDGGRVHSHFE